MRKKIKKKLRINPEYFAKNTKGEPFLLRKGKSILRLLKDTEISSLSAFIGKCGGVFKASKMLRMRPSKLRQVLEERYVSPSVEEKIEGVLRQRRPPAHNTATKFSMEQELLNIYNLYKQKGSMSAVGKEIGVSRHQVRQLLVDGSLQGLFEYKFLRPVYPPLSKEKILNDYRRSLSLIDVAKTNGVPYYYLQKLLTTYGVTKKDLNSLRAGWFREDKKKQCIELYDQIVKEFGHHPTTLELQKSKWRYFYVRVARAWGTYDEFREEMNIPKPRSFLEAVQEWRVYSRNHALAFRMQKLNRMRDCLKTSGPMSLRQIMDSCIISENMVRQLLKSLREAKEVVKERKGRYIEYRLLKSQER